MTDAEIASLRDPEDYSVIADNIVHVAELVVERREFKSRRKFSRSARETAVAEIKRELTHTVRTRTV